MNDNDKIALLRERFIHRSDVFSTQWYEDGKMGYRAVREGTCIAIPPCKKGTCSHVRDVPLSDAHLREHLLGGMTIATYQLTDENTVKWLCFDVDLKKGMSEELEGKVKGHTLALAKKLHQILGQGSFLVERSGSKGFHLWVFFSEPVPAFKVMALGKYVDGQIEHPFGIDVEVYPKQTRVHSYGNMVKIPLGIHRKTEVRCFFVDNQFKDHENQFEVLANVRNFTEKELDEIITKHEIVMSLSIRIDNQQVQSYGALPCMTNMMIEGLHEGARDEGFLRLASWMKRRGIPEDVAQVAIYRVNDKTKPSLDSNTVDRKIDNAYTNDHTEFPCNNSAFDLFCTSSCRYFQNKSDVRWRRLGKEGDGRGVISRD